MKGEIIAVGSELLLGQIANTDAQFLSKHLANIGVDVFFHTVVGDNPNRLKQVLEIAEKRSDLIILTGGLGPTKDDLTKETIARFTGKKLAFDEKALASIEQFFRKLNRPMTENNRKQALVIEGSTVLPNDNGMAPGMVFTARNKTFMLLPGPPHELNPMYLNYGEREILKLLEEKEKIVSLVLRFFGIGEAQLEKEIEDLIDAQSNPTIAPLASNGEVTLRLTAKHKSEEEANRLIGEVEKKIMARVGKYFYGYNSTTLMKKVFEELEMRNWTISAAESLTGGLFQQELTSISGASKIFAGGVVCYATEVKEKILKVSKETIDTVGVVSSQCAEELAENVRKMMNTDVGISFTGVAGPDKQEGKPAGTVYIGISIKGEPAESFKLQLSGSRDRIRSLTVKHGCRFLLKTLQKRQDEFSDKS